MDIAQDDLRTLLISSFRYALGRRTYIVGETINIIKSNHRALPQRDKQQMIRDIDLAIDRGVAGMECDVKAWLGLVEFIRVDAQHLLSDKDLDEILESGWHGNKY